MSATFERFANEVRVFFGFPPKVYLDMPEATGPRTHFMDIHRRVRIYLRALWDDDFTLKQTDLETAHNEDKMPFIEDNHIYLPNALHDSNPGGAREVSGLELYRAAAAHAAAHLVYSKNGFSPRSLDKWQIAMISLIEDARVEALTIRKYPGLRRLWASLHDATPRDNKTAGDYMNRLARALLDETYQDDDPWIAEGRELFKSARNLENPRVSREIGVALADSFLKKNIKYNFGLDMLWAPYLDDNQSMWHGFRRPTDIVNPYFRSKTIRRVDEEVKDPKKIRPDAKEAEVDTDSLQTFYYPEWNYRSQSSDPSWVTLRETSPATGELKIVDDIIAQNKHLVTRMKNLLHAIRDGAVHRDRKLEVGDEIDINAAIRAQIDIRLGMQPDTRVMMRTVRKSRDISVLMLLDLSRSMNNKIRGREHTALELTQQVSVLFANAIEAVGDPFAIHGFCSESRHNVEYFRIKDFDQHYDDASKVRMAGMTGQLGTRMGAAIRHATHHLNNQKSSKKLLIILSDGEPSDVDVPDKHYLRDDAKKSVEEAGHDGIHTYCISLDPSADRYVSRIFGAKNYMVVDHIKHLPEKILLIYAALTR
jgi:nitric oxide reductase NorD protein